MFDVSKMTCGETAKVEELSGLPIHQIGNADSPKGLALAALAFVAKRREDPAFTWNAAQGLTLDEANAILGIGQKQEDQSDPLDESSASPKKTRAKH